VTDAALDAFTQAQMDAAKLVQQRTQPGAEAPNYSLETDLRPAVARITARMAWLVGRLPAELDETTVLQQARDWLGASGLEPAEVERIARTLAALRPRQPQGSLSPRDSQPLGAGMSPRAVPLGYSLRE
jgi:cyclohexadienyl dehydratase